MTELDRRPLVIVNGSFRCTLFSIEKMTTLPVKNITVLWNLMFEAAYENEAAAERIYSWFTPAINRQNEYIEGTKKALADARKAAEEARRTAAAFGSAVTKAQLEEAKRKALNAVKMGRAVSAAERTLAKYFKLQSLFNELREANNVPKHTHKSANG